MSKEMVRVGSTVQVDLETGEETPVENGGAYLLPAAPGTCEECAVAHDPQLPHNQQSLFYQMRFHGLHGRWPTWTDAMAHCEPDLRAAWRGQLLATLKKHGMDIPADLKDA